MGGDIQPATCGKKDTRIVTANLGEDLVGGGSSTDLVLQPYAYTSTGGDYVSSQPQRVANGDYDVEFFLDLDGSEGLTTGEPVMVRRITVDGDTLIQIAAADLTPAITTSFTAVNTESLPQDATVLIRFLCPGTAEPVDARYFLVLYAPYLSSGVLSPFLYAAIAPGSYDLYIHLEVDGGASLGVYPPVWDVDTGEYILKMGNVTVATTPIELDGAAFVMAP